jgi:hypothetical protein
MIKLTQHAHTETARRGIRLAWIEAALTTPDRIMQDPDPTLTRSYKAITQFGGRVLRVVHRPDGNDILIVTAHFDRGARR